MEETYPMFGGHVTRQRAVAVTHAHFALGLVTPVRPASVVPGSFTNAKAVLLS